MIVHLSYKENKRILQTNIQEFRFYQVLRVLLYFRIFDFIYNKNLTLILKIERTSIVY